MTDQQLLDMNAGVSTDAIKSALKQRADKIRELNRARGLIDRNDPQAQRKYIMNRKAIQNNKELAENLRRLLDLRERRLVKDKLLIDDPTTDEERAYNQGVLDANDAICKDLEKTIKKIRIPALKRSGSPARHAKNHAGNLEIRDAHDIKHKCLEVVMARLKGEE